jgi:hypothetical protein
MLDRTFERISNIRNLSELKLPLLFFALALWVVIPILGIFPLLLVVQLDLLRSKQRRPKIISLNNILLTLVVITIAIYVSSFEVFADTKIYLDTYEQLDTKGIFDNSFVEDRYEFVLFLLLYPINLITNGSIYWCLILFSLLTNSLVVFYISKNFSARYYPSLLIILFSTSFYYSQIFYMRQFLSLVLVMMAIASMESSLIIFVLCSFLAIFAHLSSAMYIVVCLIVKIAFFITKNIKIKLEKRDKIFMYLGIAFLLLFFVYIGAKIYNNPEEIYGYVNNLLDYVPEQELGNTLQTRVENYDKRDVELFEFTIYRIIATVTLGLFAVFRNYKNISSKKLSLIIIYGISILQIAFIQVTGFNQRIAYLFLAFFGLFFCIGLDDNSKIKTIGAISFMTMFVASVNSFDFIKVQANMIDVPGWSFFDDQPLAMSLYDYILYFFTSI